LGWVARATVDQAIKEAARRSFDLAIYIRIAAAAENLSAEETGYR
jgi:hypothetical protein